MRSRRNGPALTPGLALMAQVWRALCKPLNQEVAVKLVNLERQDVDLVRIRVESIICSIRLRARRMKVRISTTSTSLTRSDMHATELC